MSSTGLKVALIGVGNHGPLFPKILEHTGRGSKITSLVDTNLRALETVGREWDIPAECRYTSVAAFLDDAGNRDHCVIVSTPAVIRSPVIECLGEGLNVFCENPLTLSLRSLPILMDARRCVVNEQWRYLASVERAREFFKDGAIGDIVSIHLGGKGREPWTEFQRIGTHLLSVAIHTFLHRDVINGCSAVATDWLGQFSQMLVHLPEPSAIVAVWETDCAVPIYAELYDAGYDVRKCFLEVRGTRGRIKLIGGLLEGLWVSHQPADTVDQVGAWERLPVDGMWDIHPGDEQRALLDPNMNSTFSLWDSFERMALEEIDPSDVLSPAKEYTDIAVAAELLVASVNRKGAVVTQDDLG